MQGWVRGLIFALLLVIAVFGTLRLKPRDYTFAAGLELPVVIETVREGVVISDEIVMDWHFSPSSISPTTVLSKKDVVGKIAKTNLLRYQPIQRDEVDDFVVIPVPSRVITAGTRLTREVLTTTNIAASELTTDTLLSFEEIVPDGITVTTVAHLLPGRPVLKHMIVRQPAPVELQDAFVAKRALRAFHIVKAGDFEVDKVERSLLAGGTAAGDPNGKLLLVPLQPGDVVLEAHIITAMGEADNIVAIAVSATGALNGNLQPGDIVDIHATPRLVPDSGGRLAPLDVPNADAWFPITETIILGIAAQGKGYLVTLGVEDEEDAAAIIEAAPRVEFNVVLRPGQ